MALHYDGFEQFVSDNALLGALKRAGYVTSGPIVTASGRNNSIGLGLENSRLTRVHPWPGNTVSVGVAIQYELRGAMLWVQSGDDRMMLWIDEETGNPHLNGTRCGSIPVPKTYYYYELELDRAADVVRLFVNGRPDGQAPIPGNMGAAAELTVGIGFPENSTDGFPPAPIVGSPRLIDDLYINTGSHLGPITVTTRFPDYDSKTVEWSTSEGSYHWSLVNRRPPGLNNAYIVSDDIGAKDLFHSRAPLKSNKRIISMGLVVLARRSPEFAGRLRGIVGDGINADERSAVVDVDTDWRTQYITFPENGSDTKEGIEVATFGVRAAE